MVDLVLVTDMVLGTLNAQVSTSGYQIYGMGISDQSIDTAVEMARRNLISLVGEDKYNDPTNAFKFEGYLVDMAAMRLCVNMLGVAIPTHFNYKVNEMSISKNANPSLEEMLRQLERSINQWMRFILSDNWTGIVEQDDLYIEPINTYGGITYINRDADPMQGSTLNNYDRK